MHLPALSDRELAHHADIEFDPLTATDLQSELAKRFTALHRADGARCAAGCARREAPRPGHRNRALLDVLREFDIDDAATLKKILERDGKFADLMTDLAEPLASLQALATP